MTKIEGAKYIDEMARSCAEAFHSSEYATRVADLLAGTAATESYAQGEWQRRQVGFDWDNDRGAWGLWQMERVALQEVLRFAESHPAVAQQAVDWAFGEGVSFRFWEAQDVRTALRWLGACDRFACVCARLYYMTFAPVIPEKLEDQAAYYKKYWNTQWGSGSPEKYLRDWNNIIVPARQVDNDKPKRRSSKK